MKKVIIGAALCFLATGCSLFESSSTSSSGTTTVTLTPVGGVVCDIESTVATGLAGSIASALNCTSQSAIVSSLEAALGNANLCGVSTSSSVAQAQIFKAEVAVLNPAWKTLGDIPASALGQSSAIKSKAVFSKGVIGSIACPIVIETSVGYLSNVVPTGWGCTSSTTMASIESALTTECESLISI